MTGRISLPTITPWHGESIGTAILGAQGNNPWPSNNRAYAIPFDLDAPCPDILGGFCWNGDNATGNHDIAVYDNAFVRLASIGSTARSGTATIQSTAFSSALDLEPGRYYMALVLSSTTGTVVRATTDSNHLKNLGVKQMDSALPLPDPFVPVAMASSFLPMFGLYRVAP